MQHPSGSQKGPPPIWTNLKLYRILKIATKRPTTTKRPWCSTSETRMGSSHCTVLAKVLSPPSILIHSGQHSSPGTVEPSEVCDSDGTMYQCPHCHLRGSPGECSYPLARRLLRARMIEEIVQSQAPIKTFCPHQSAYK